MREPKNSSGNDQCAALLDLFDSNHSPMVALARRIGVTAIDSLLEEFGGQKIHIPTVQNFWAGLARELRNEAIRTRFRGNNFTELALDFRIQERQLRNILARSPRRCTPKRRGADRKVVATTEYAALARFAREGGISIREAADLAVKLGLREFSKNKPGEGRAKECRGNNENHTIGDGAVRP